MDNCVSRGRELVGDIEDGGSSGNTEVTENLLSENRKPKKILDSAWPGQLLSDGPIRSENGASSCANSQKLGRIEHDDLELLIDNNSGERICEDVGMVEKTCAEGKCKKNSRKPPKPPRPPKGPSLSANDQKLVKDIAELAMRKRARIERMKALKKMKAAKTSSSCSSIAAMIITILFFIILVFQGLFSRSSATVGLDGSPAPAVAANEGLISVQFYNEFAPHERNNPGPISSSPSEKRVSGADSEEDVRKVAM